MADEVLAAELDAEQAFVDRVYVQLERSARNARALAREGHGRGALGHEGGLVERDAMVFQAARTDRPARRRPRGAGVRPARPARDPGPRAPLHRPDRPARRRPGLAADRLARPGRRGLLPGHRRRAPRRDPAPGAALPGSQGRRRRGRAARRRGRHRPADRRRGRADGPAVSSARPLHALDRRHHPGRAGQGDPRAGQGRGRDQRWSRHRQDGRGAAPRGVPPLLRPPPLRVRRRARRRARPASSCATSSGSCRRSARPRSRCGRSARWSAACVRRGTTRRRSRG